MWGLGARLRAGGATPARPAPPQPVAISSLQVDRSGSFLVRAEKRSLGVVEHYNRELAARGWSRAKPSLMELPGHRRWFGSSSGLGRVEVFDAAWEDPASGRVAVLTLWYAVGDPGTQYGAFEIFDKNRAPL